MEKDCKARVQREELNVEKDITFGELRCYVSRIDRLSLCMLETMNYENFIRIRDVPYAYDRYYVYGIGMIESEFYKTGPYSYTAKGKPENLDLVPCMEIMLSKEPKSVLVKREKSEYKQAKVKGEPLATESRRRVPPQTIT